MPAYRFERLPKEIDGASTTRELERLVKEKLAELGEGWRLPSVAPYFHDPLVPPALKARIVKQEILPPAPEVGDYIVIFERA